VTRHVENRRNGIWSWLSTIKITKCDLDATRPLADRNGRRSRPDANHVGPLCVFYLIIIALKNSVTKNDSEESQYLF